MDSGFEEALHRAIGQINSPAFLGVPGIFNTPSSHFFVQFKNDHHTNNYNTYSHNELNIHPVVKEDVPAKEPSVPNDIIRQKQKGVFSKRQVIIFLELLSQCPKFEYPDLQNPNKHESFAQFLHALTGKSKETWLEALQNYRAKDLYAFHDSHELGNLLNALTNLSDTLRTAGLRTLSNQAIKKIKELEAKK
jgi:hypothetical protein